MQPLSSEIGTFKTAKARCWAWLEPVPGESLLNRAVPSPPDSGCFTPYALTPNTVELIPTLGALSPRGGPVQDPLLTHSAGVVLLLLKYRGISLIRNRPPLGPYSRNMPRAIRWSKGGGLFLLSEVPLYLAGLVACSRCPRCTQQYDYKGISSTTRKWIIHRPCGSQYTGTSLITHSAPLGLYSRTMPMALRGPCGRGRFLKRGNPVP